MFLFLSKLLPIFLYPLGLSCLLLLLALVLLWKRPRWAALSILLTLALLLGTSNGFAAGRMLQSLEWQHVPSGDLPTADAIVVLGGATRPQLAPRPWVDLAEEGDRVLHGAKLYREGKAPKVILSGGRNEWMGEATPESIDMATLMKTMGVPESAILQDSTSLNTRENALNTKQIMEAQGIRRILLVTSAVHMPRSLLIFKKLGIDAIPAPTDFITVYPDAKLGQPTAEGNILNSLPDPEHLKNFTRVLKEYVGIFVYRLRGWA